MLQKPLPRALCFALLAGVIADDALARVKLITLPVRERVEIQLDHPSVTLVEEERIVPLVQGENQVDFSWANTPINPDTIVFRVLPSGADGPDVKVLAVSYPPNENALVWSVAADAAGAARVRISYTLGGLTKEFHYRAVAARDEKNLTLAEYVRVNNAANEDYDQSQVWVGVGEQIAKPIGLNETKEVLIGKFTQVPVQKTYTSDPAEFGYLDEAQRKLNVPMHYVLKNDAAHGLGKAPLPYGKARIFQDDGKGASAFLGEDWGKFTPLDDEMRLFLGLARDIGVKRTIARNERTRIAGNLYRHDIEVQYDIENFKDSPARLDLVESAGFIRNEVGGSQDRDPQWTVGDHTTLKDGPDADKSDHDRIVFHVDLPAREGASQARKISHTLHLVFQNEW